MVRFKDSLKNGTILGALAGFFIWQGAPIYTWLLTNTPSYWTQTIPLWVWLVVSGSIIGYIVDRI